MFFEDFIVLVIAFAFGTFAGIAIAQAVLL